MSKDTFIEDFWNLFGGRRDVYARSFPHRNPEKRALGKLEYAPVRQPFTDAVLATHLRGEQLLGIYPIVDGKVTFAAIDFDAPKVRQPDGKWVEAEGDPFPTALAEAVAHAERLEAEGLNVYLERSRSGKGVHLWMFFDGWIDGNTVRRAIKPLLVKEETLDRLYPVQGDTANLGKQLGNLIALPFNGECAKQGFSSFINPDTLEPIAPRDFLAAVKRNYAAVIERLAEKAPRDPKERTKPKVGVNPTTGAVEDIPTFDAGDGRPEIPLKGWCKAQSQYGCAFLHHCWVNRERISEPEWYAAIQQATAFEKGREIAHAISRDYKGYDPAEVDRKFDHAMESPPMGCARIHDQFPHIACNGCLHTAPYHMARKTILELAQQAADGTEHGGFDEFLDECFEFDAGKRTPGIKVGQGPLDNLLTLRRNEYIIVAARPSMGKTALLVDWSNNIATTLADKDGVEVRGPHPVIVFSGETGRDGLRTRLLAHEAGVDSLAIRGERRAGDAVLRLTDDERARLVAAAKSLNQKPIFINYTALDPDRMIEIIEDTCLDNGIPLDEHIVVIFDYVQFGVTAENISTRERVNIISAQLKYMCKILGCTVVAMAQLGRAAERKDKDGETKEADLTDLKESGNLEQDADGIIIMTGQRTPQTRTAREMNLQKQREGPIGKALYFLDKSTCRFEPPKAYTETQRTAGDLLSDDPPAFVLTSEDEEEAMTE